MAFFSLGKHTRTYLLKFIKCIILIVPLAIITGSIMLGSERGRLYLVNIMIEKFEQSTGFQISMSDLSTPSLDQWYVSSVSVRYQQQLLMVADNVKLTWQPSALFDHNVVIEQIMVRSLLLHELTLLKDLTYEDHQSKGNALSLPNVLLKQLSIQSLNLKHILSDKADKDNASIAINASVQWLQNSSLQAEISGKGFDPVPTEFYLQLQSNDWREVKLTGSLKEVAGGFVGGVLQIPKKQAIDSGFDVTVSKPSERLSIDMDNVFLVVAKKKLIAQGRIAASLENKDVYIEDLTLFIDNTQHAMSGSWVNQKLSLDLSINKLPLHIIKPWQKFVDGGELSAKLKIDGNILQPDIQGSLHLNTVYKRLPLSIDFVGALNKNVVNIEKLTALFADSEIVAQGRLDTTSDALHVQIMAKNMDIKKLDLFDIHVPNTLNATITYAQGSLYGGVDNLQGNVIFYGEGNYKNQSFTIESHLIKNETSLFIKNTYLTMREGRVSLEGDLQTQTFDTAIKMQIEAMPLDVLKLADQQLPESLDAQLNTKIYVSGNLYNPTIVIDSQIKGVYQKIPFILTAKGQQNNNDYQLDTLTVSAFNEPLLSATGYVKKELFDVRIQAAKLPAQFFSALGWHMHSGNFNADIHALGSLSSPVIEGQLNYQTVLNGYEQGGKRKGIHFIWNVDINTEANDVNVKSTFKRGKDQPGELLLALSIKPYIDYILQKKPSSELQDLPLNALSKGKFNLQTTYFLLDPNLHNLTGNIDIDMNITGTLKKPQLKGKLHIDETRYENPITGTLIDKLDCWVNAEHMILHLASCHASDGYEGKYVLAGTLHLPINDSSGNIELKVQTSGANILRRPDIESQATGEVSLSGDFKSLLISGDLDVTPFTAVFGANFSDGIPSIDVEEVQFIQEAQEQKQVNLSTALLPDFQYNLVIRANKQAYLRGRGLETELRGQIKVQGNAKKILYEGEFKTLQGVFEVFNKKFKIEQGQVNFGNNTIVLAITGIYEKNGQRILAEVTGTNDDITFNFTAVPQIPRDDILAFIIFGKSIQRITPFEAIQLASAMQTLRGESHFWDPIKSTRDILAIDTLSIKSGTTKEGQNGVNIGFGKYLSEKVYIELERIPNLSQPWRGYIEIELTPSMMLESSSGGKTGIEGVRIKWKRDY